LYIVIIISHIKIIESPRMIMIGYSHCWAVRRKKTK